MNTVLKGVCLNRGMEICPTYIKTYVPALRKVKVRWPTPELEVITECTSYFKLLELFYALDEPPIMEEGSRRIKGHKYKVIKGTRFRGPTKQNVKYLRKLKSSSQVLRPISESTVGISRGGGGGGARVLIL